LSSRIEFFYTYQGANALFYAGDSLLVDYHPGLADPLYQADQLTGGREVKSGKHTHVIKDINSKKRYGSSEYSPFHIASGKKSGEMQD
jgi:hypothetical protein